MSTLGYLRSVREWATPTRTTTAFLEKGVLTPEEFVRAGDELVFRCPTWSWEAGDADKRRSFLPSDKQYLVTRNVPCTSRVEQLEATIGTLVGTGNDDNENDDDTDEWMISTIVKPEDPQQQKGVEDEFDILDETGEVIVEETKPAATQSTADDNKDDKNDNDNDGYADMDDFEDDNVLADQDTATPMTKANDSNNNNADNVLKVRTYDLSITYDKYYQTPRVWMVGTSATGQPLTAEEMMQDVMTDYAHKTVTMEHHPHIAGQHASIHPCQHGKVMLRIVQNLMRLGGDGNDEPTVEMYLFIFLKFVNSIIPSINYDFTMEVEASTQKG